ncbi:hypothetical protein AUJ68_05150 [Candidatus Woesearchaeota archaeon CG1_02_57_44]|nr:MAG: hypothetical protein AUJ68_05150 [Candidatus Woesearchaeota archaeon CG1_02_57_44]PIN70000.1 MAG: hypothetical protein COV94_02260 [Candidatus Woesearchaeota archaeon CG11_big_fil_rev_8_21_14_0_20_57_5]
MLGLGLGFTKSMFSKISESIKIPAPNNPATEQDPIGLSVSSAEFSKTGNAQLDFNFYNDGTYPGPTGTNAEKFIAGIVCYDSGNTAIDLIGNSGGALNVITSAQDVPIASSVTFSILFPKDMMKPAGLLKPGSYVCKVGVCAQMGANAPAGCGRAGSGGTAFSKSKQMTIKVS